MYGSDMLRGISKVTSEISHKISYPYIERCNFSTALKFWELLDLRNRKHFLNAPWFLLTPTVSFKPLYCFIPSTTVAPYRPDPEYMSGMTKKHLEACIKWLMICRQHSSKHFLERKKNHTLFQISLKFVPVHQTVKVSFISSGNDDKVHKKMIFPLNKIRQSQKGIKYSCHSCQLPNRFHVLS